MQAYHIFIVEDDPWYGEILDYHLSLNPDYKISRFTSGNECLDNLYLKPDLITLDYSLPDINGKELLKKIQDKYPDIPIIIISGQEDIHIAVDLLKRGIKDYLVKDDHTKDLLWNAVARIRENQMLKQEVESLREELGQKFAFEKTIIGKSDPMQKIFSILEKATKTNISISITGETGTGKEIVAKAIHYNSDRGKRKFVAVNMAAIPKDLVESELFGYEKGAFTGAISRKLGKFEEANGGTIFLDEIAELDLNLQSKILRVLQEREVTRVGGNEVIKFDARIIIATHRNLADEVKNGNFREDLYYRLMGLPIDLPPLRDRGNDVIILAKMFADEFAKANRMKSITIAKEAKDKLLRYQFPGNVRELKAVIELAAVMCEGNEIAPDDITFKAIKQEDMFLLEEKTLRNHTIDIIRFYLNKFNNDVVETANRLDIGKSTIYKMIKDGEL